MADFYLRKTRKIWKMYSLTFFISGFYSVNNVTYITQASSERAIRVSEFWYWQFSGVDKHGYCSCTAPILVSRRGLSL